jgi:hypothetical protein
MLRQTLKVQADICNPTNVIIKRALALTLNSDLLMKGLANVLKARNRQNGFVNQGWLTPFFSSENILVKHLIISHIFDQLRE